MTIAYPAHSPSLACDPRVWALLFAASLTTMANATIAPALTGLEAAYGDQPHAALLIRLLVPAPSLSIILFASMAGMAVDRHGRKRVLMLGLVLFVLAGPAGYFLEDLSLIFGSRLLLGVGVALIMTAQTTIVGDLFTGSRRATLNGLQISARNLGGLVFIALAGWLAGLSPHLPFLVYGLAILLLPLVALSLHDISSAHQREDGAAHRPHTDPQERDSESDHAGWFGQLLALATLQGFTSLCFFLMPTQLPFYLQDLGYDSGAMTGILLAVLMFFGGVAALWYGWLKRRVPYVIVFGSGYALMALGMGLMALDGGVWGLASGAASVGFGFALVMPNFVTLMLQLAPESHRGRASGILSTSIFLGQLLSPLASMPVIAAFGFQGAFGLFGVILALVAGIAFVQALRLSLPR
ncbi:MFS transporter [Cohaesibacter sp. CAU 1516]|uniref:MFS transporter n=1 Tax=Cohaesibacter sp. CAU 1516 TaxID=2576038 RepID=UPI0010FD1939|nr:MFS transporter [Cohaesibacter sp. CAU 1516]TLP45546.1 MFS transporter [Cohaesibacter sp. CAU 1516]